VVGNANAGSGQQNDFSNGDFFNGTDIHVLRAGGSSEVLNLSKNGSASVTVTNVLKDDNANPANTTVGDFSPGNRNVVNTLPTLPPAPAACSLPPGPGTIDGTTSDGPPPSGTVARPEQPAAAQTSGVTSRPFVSLARPALRPVASAVGTRTLTPSSQGATGSSTQPSRSTTPVTRIVPNPQGSGGTVSVNIGTLKPGDSVTITFQVVIDNPYSGGPNVSNQGTVSGSNFSNVLTDDPAVGGAADPTLTPINVTNIAAQDAQGNEPASGTSPMLFTVTLSSPASGGGVSVNYARLGREAWAPTSSNSTTPRTRRSRSRPRMLRQASVCSSRVRTATRRPF